MLVTVYSVQNKSIQIRQRQLKFCLVNDAMEEDRQPKRFDRLSMAFLCFLKNQTMKKGENQLIFSLR